MLFNFYMKKLAFLLIIFAFLLPFFNFSVTFAENETKNYVVTANSAVLFSEPDFSSEKLNTLSHNTVVSIEMEAESAKAYAFENYVFFKVLNFEGVDGFVLADLVVPDSSQIEDIPNFNASTNARCQVFMDSENDIFLEKGQRIFLYQGYDKNLAQTAVAFVYDGQVLYGHIDTEFVAPDGINPAIITSVVVIIALLGIIFAWLFMKKVKVKSKK